MAHFWICDEAGKWVVLQLSGDCYALEADREQPVRACACEPTEAERILVQRHKENGRPEAWVLMAAADAALKVNGSALPTGIRLLRDKDAIAVGDLARFYFSTERLACSVPFPEFERPTYCARCKQRIVQDQQAVCCPQCGAWCHNSEDVHCWSYTPVCPHCDQPTELNSEFRWSPEQL